MSNWRSIKRKALGQVHATFQVPAVYLTHAAGTPVSVNVRLHTRQITSDQQVDDWTHAGVVLDMTNRIIFQKTELAAVLPKAFVVVGAAEVYRTGPTKPEREGFIWCEVSELGTSEITALFDQLATADPDYASDPVWQGVLG